MKFIRKHLSEIIACCLVLVAILFSSKALFHSGFYRTIDDITTVRINHMARELKRGEWVNNFPVRYGAELSHKYGYFVYLFYSPLVYYVGAIFMILTKASDIIATKIVYVIPLIIGPALFYFAARQKLGKFPALMATILYALFPFRGFDTYIRGGVGEAWAMAFFPAVIGSLFLMEKKNLFAKYIFPIFLALVILSHNISGLLVVICVFLYGLVFLQKEKSFWIGLLYALGLSSFFWLPSLYYSGIVKVAESVDHNGLVTNYLMSASKLLTPSLAYDIHDKTSPFIAYILIAGGIVYLSIRKTQSKIAKYLLFWTALGLALYFALSEQSKWLWTFALPISRNLQFPWRILIVLSSIIPLVFGYIVQAVQAKWIRAILAVFLVGITSIYMVTFKPIEYSYYYNYIVEDTGPCASSWGDEYMGKWVDTCISNPAPFILKMPGDTVYTTQKDSLIDTSLTMHTSTGGYLEAQRYYFPGWQIKVDDQIQKIDYTYSKNGIFRTNVEPGDHRVEVSWSKTGVMWLADILTLLSIIAVVIGFTREYKNHKI